MPEEASLKILASRVVSGRAFLGAPAAALLLVFAVVFASASAGAQGPAKMAGAQSARSGAQGRESSVGGEAYAELPNFHKVNAHLFRGGQPREGGLARLAALGVKTILNLRDDDARAVEEGREAAALGLRYFNVPISRAGRPSRERIAELMAILDAPGNQPVFVHCKRGADRTGALIAVYRITHDGWTGARALEEAEQYGMGFWQRGKKDFINDFYRDRANTQAETEPKASH